MGAQRNNQLRSRRRQRYFSAYRQLPALRQHSRRPCGRSAPRRRARPRQRNSKKLVGTTESYDFTEKDGLTTLTVSMDVYPEWQAMFNSDWPKALAALKAVCEEE